LTGGKKSQSWGLRLLGRTPVQKGELFPLVKNQTGTQKKTQYSGKSGGHTGAQRYREDEGAPKILKGCSTHRHCKEWERKDFIRGGGGGGGAGQPDSFQKRSKCKIETNEDRLNVELKNGGSDNFPGVADLSGGKKTGPKCSIESYDSALEMRQKRARASWADQETWAETFAGG